jgi:ATP-dependent DNA helicase RecG
MTDRIGGVMNLGNETKKLEFKEKVSATYLKTVSAFANYNDGEIFFGVRDNGDVVGVENALELSLNIENTINDSIVPRPYFSLKVAKLNNKEVVIVKVLKGDQQPYLRH